VTVTTLPHEWITIPSNDPEKKNLNLEIFSTDIVEYISIDKVYGGSIIWRLCWGNVDIISKDYKMDFKD
jgi:hypothetical protein